MTELDPSTVTDPTDEAAVSLVNHWQRPAYFEQLAGTVEEVGRLRWLLGEVVILADDAPALTDVELRARLLALAESCAR